MIRGMGAWFLAVAMLALAGPGLRAESVPVAVKKSAAALVATSLPKLEALAADEGVVAEIVC